MPVRHNRDGKMGEGPKSLSAGLGQGKLSMGSEPKSLFSQLKGGGKHKGKKSGLHVEGKKDVKTDITFGGAKSMMKKVAKKKK